jgi:hypothetical protein
MFQILSNKNSLVSADSTCNFDYFEHIMIKDLRWAVIYQLPLRAIETSFVSFTFQMIAYTTVVNELVLIFSRHHWGMPRCMGTLQLDRGDIKRWLAIFRRKQHTYNLCRYSILRDFFQRFTSRRWSRITTSWKTKIIEKTLIESTGSYEEDISCTALESVIFVSYQVCSRMLC